MTNKIRLVEWARRQGVHRQTALKWVHAGTFPGPGVPERSPGGLFFVCMPSSLRAEEDVDIPTFLYARVSGSDQRFDLARQVERLQMFASARGLQVEVVSEVGSGLNGKRRKLLKVLAQPGPKRIVVEHRDRLARFGVDYLEVLLVSQGGELLVVETGEQKLDLVQDFIDVVTSMCARIYGRRAAKNRAKRAIAAAEEAE